jgi:hypothetical protein
VAKLNHDLVSGFIMCFLAHDPPGECKYLLFTRQPIIAVPEISSFHIGTIPCVSFKNNKSEIY